MRNVASFSDARCQYLRHGFLGRHGGVGDKLLIEKGKKKSRGFEAGEEKTKHPYSTARRKVTSARRKKARFIRKIATARQHPGMLKKRERVKEAWPHEHEFMNELEFIGIPQPAPILTQKIPQTLEEVVRKRNRDLFRKIRGKLLAEHFGEVVVIARGEYRLARTFEEAIKVAREEFPDEKHRIIWDTKREKRLLRVPRIRGREFKYIQK